MTPQTEALIAELHGKVTMRELKKIAGISTDRIYEYLISVGKYPKNDSELTYRISKQVDGVFDVDEFKCWVTGGC